MEKAKEKSTSDASRVVVTRRFFPHRGAWSQPYFLWACGGFCRHWGEIGRGGDSDSNEFTTTLQKKEDGKTFVCDKRDRAITCVFCRDLDVALHVFWSFTKSSV